MSFSRRTLSLVTIVLILGALGAGVYWRLGPPPGESETPVESTEQPDPAMPAGAAQFSTSAPQPVAGFAVIRDTLWIQVGAAGQAEAFRRTTVTAQVAGVLQAVPVRENEPIGAGAGLVLIDSTEYALRVAQARADLLTAQADYEQLILFDDEIEDPAVRAGRERIARSRSRLDQSEVALRQAEIELARARVVAPFGGRVADIEVVEGQYVRVGDELLTVVDLDPIKVEVQVLEAELGYLAEGRGAEVTFAAYPRELFSGTIETINPVVDPESRTGRVTLVLANADGRIKPGMYAEVTLNAEALPDRILVPRAAILERDRRTMLFVHEEAGGFALAKWRYVNTGRENDEFVEILREGPEQDMVEPGEVVLVDGHHYLAHDTAVQLVADVAAAGGRPGR